MSEESSGATPEMMEALICRLPSVMRCQIVLNDWGGIEEIHVLTTLERSAKQIVRDVESALRAEWNIHVDHKRISVAQIRSDEPARPRPLLEVREVRTEIDALDGRVGAEVELSPVGSPGETYRGEWSGSYVPSHYPLSVAQAAVDAINQVPEVGAGFVFSELRALTLGGKPVVVVALSYLNPRRREEVVVGAAAEAGDPQAAAAHAVVDAANRWLMKPPSFGPPGYAPLPKLEPTTAGEGGEGGWSSQTGPNG